METAEDKMVGQIPKTALDVFRMLPEGALCEVFDNALYMYPTPKYQHQKLLMVLLRQVGAHIERTRAGDVAVSHVDVYFEDLNSAVQPDLLIICSENIGIIKEDGYIYGAPDFVFYRKMKKEIR